MTPRPIEVRHYDRKSDSWATTARYASLADAFAGRRRMIAAAFDPGHVVVVGSDGRMLDRPPKGDG